MDRLVPLPDARLQRFGVNNTQLFGKPMVDLTISRAKPVSPQQAPSRTTQAESQTSAFTERPAGQKTDQLAGTPVLAPGYSGRGLHVTVGQNASTPGAIMNTVA